MAGFHLSNYWRRINPFAQVRLAEHEEHIYNQKTFHCAIQRERARSDRTGNGFSLVLFHVSSERGINTLAGQLIEILVNRLRCTDELGWFDQNQIGVLLFDTTTEQGAQRFVSYIKEASEKARHDKLSFPDYKVYVYPKDWKGGQHDGDPIKADQAKNKNSQYFKKTQLFFSNSLPWWKRQLDILGAFIGILLLTPLFLIVALYIKIISPNGPVFFRQERIGLSGKPFTMWKLRTMKPNIDSSAHKAYLASLIHADEDIPMTKQNDKSQFLFFGRVLRKSCIDELPQLINVFKGEMSMVGPRPPVAYEAEEYEQWQHSRFDVLPGMTGLWQVSGKNRLSFNQMIRLDIRYARHLTFWQEIWILLWTPVAIIGQIKDSFVKRIKRYSQKIKDKL